MSDREIIDQFGESAQLYVNSPSHAAGFGLDLLMASKGLKKGVEALDVATGGGHTAFAMASFGARVTALDLTPEMLEAARDEAKRRDLNIRFIEGNAEALPFEVNAFSLVTCRIAPHHFHHPKRFVEEVCRVLKCGGTFVLIDNVSSERADYAGPLNHIEKMRDPSHVRAYTVGEWCKWISDCGLDIDKLERWTKRKDFKNWVVRSKTSQDRVREIVKYAQSLPKSVQDYMEIIYAGNSIANISHETVFIVAGKTE